MVISLLQEPSSECPVIKTIINGLGPKGEYAHKNAKSSNENI